MLEMAPAQPKVHGQRRTFGNILIIYVFMIPEKAIQNKQQDRENDPRKQQKNWAMYKWNKPADNPSPVLRFEFKNTVLLALRITCSMNLLYELLLSGKLALRVLMCPSGA